MTENANTDVNKAVNSGVCTVSEVVVRYQETDQMGVAHHSVYPVWFEVGRTEFIKEHGISYGRLETEGLYMPLIELACKYRSFARYEDTLCIRTTVCDVSRSRITFAYEVYKVSSDCAPTGIYPGVPTVGMKPVAVGSTTHVFANSSLAPVNVSRYRPELYELFMSLRNASAGE